MATKLKNTVGTMACLCCGVSMPVKQAENGTLDLSCKDCDLSAYAKEGTAANRRALARITRRPEDDGHKPTATAKAAAQAVAAPAPAPAATARRSVFHGL